MSDLTEYRLAADDRMASPIERGQFIGELLCDVEILVARGGMFDADGYREMVDAAAGRVVRRRRGVECSP